MKQDKKIKVLCSPFDVTKVELLPNAIRKRYAKHTGDFLIPVKIIEGSQKGTILNVAPVFLFPLKMYQELHNKKYH